MRIQSRKAHPFPAERLASTRAQAGLLVAALLFTAPSARAQAGDKAGDKAAAESLFQAGVALMSEGKFADACPKLAASQAADPSSGTLLNLASCYERIGKTASAFTTYKDAAALAHTLGQADREAIAAARIAEVEPRLSRLRIDAGDMPGLVLRRDGFEVSRASIGTPVAVDPGEHIVAASAPGFQPWSTTIVLGDNADSRTITVPPLRRQPAADAAPPLSKPPEANTTLRTAGFITGGAGIAAVGVGVAFGIIAAGYKSDAEPECDGELCSAAGYKAIDSARINAVVSTVSVGVGLAAIGASTAMVLLARPAKKESARGGSPVTAVVLPDAGPQGGGLTVLGSF